jgi:hypothetical protein
MSRLCAFDTDSHHANAGSSMPTPPPPPAQVAAEQAHLAVHVKAQVPNVCAGQWVPLQDGDGIFAPLGAGLPQHRLISSGLGKDEVAHPSRAIDVILHVCMLCVRVACESQHDCEASL